jgi:hypothetical protein
VTGAVPTIAREPRRSAAPTRREARLRPEFAARYPGIRSGIWEPAAVVADRVLAQSLLSRRGTGVRGRVLLDSHFEFRHGTGLSGERRGLRPAAE